MQDELAILPVSGERILFPTGGAGEGGTTGDNGTTGENTVLSASPPRRLFWCLQKYCKGCHIAR